MAKGTDAQVEGRVNDIYVLMLGGASYNEIQRYASSAGWGVTPRTVQTYIQRARALFREQAQTVREEELGRAIARLNDLYKRSLRIQDYKACLAIQKEMNMLLGLMVSHLDITSAGKPVKGYTVVSPDDWDNDSSADPL